MGRRRAAVAVGRRLAGALIMVLVVVGLPLSAAPPALAATVSLTPSIWDVNRDTGRVAYSVRLDVSGLRTDTLPCDGASCSWHVQALYRDGDTDRVQHLFGSGSYSGAAGSFSHTSAADAVVLAEVTHLRARVWPSAGTVADGDETVVAVSDPYPPGMIDLDVAAWDRDADSGRVTYDLTMAWRGAGGVGEPCETRCSWHVQALYRDGEVDRVQHLFASGSPAGRTWTYQQTYHADDAALAEVTHLRARVWPSAGTVADGYETVVPISDPYPPGAVDLQVDAWELDPNSGRVSYDLTMAWRGAGGVGEPCETRCSWHVQALYRDGDTDRVQHLFASGSPYGRTWTHQQTYRADDAGLAEVTHLRARVWPSAGTVADGYETVVAVGDPYPPGSIDLQVDAWDRDVDSGRVSYDLTMAWRGAGGVGEPCETRCSWHVQGLYRDGGTDLVRHLFGSGSPYGRTWTYQQTYSADNAALAEVTHVRARVWPSGGTIADGYETVVPVAVTLGLDDDQRQALAAFAPDFGFSYDPHTGLLVGGTLVALADGVCRAAETEILRGGQSKGPQYANGTLTTTQVSLQNLCLGLGAAGISVMVQPWLPGYDPLDAATWPEPDPDAHPYPDSYPDGPGGSGNWPSTAAGGFCDDGDAPPPEDRTHPLDLSTDGLSEAATQDVITYARLVNSWLAKVQSTTVISPTAEGIVDLKRSASAAARLNADDIGQPFGNQAGHVPDTALTGTPDPPCGWLDMLPEANRAATQLRWMVGQRVTHVTVNGLMP